MASPITPEGVPFINENVRATLSPLPGPHIGRSSISDVSARSSIDLNRKSWDVRRSMDASRTTRRLSHEARRSSQEIHRSFSGGVSERQSRSRLGDRSPLSQKAEESASATFSLGLGTDSSAAVQSLEDSNISASQILAHSDVFRVSTTQASSGSPHGATSSTNRQSQGTTRPSRSTNPMSNLTQPEAQYGQRPTNDAPKTDVLEADDDGDAGQVLPRLSGSSSALQDLAAYPLQKATGLAGFFRTRSKKMSSLLATESMGYYEKVSGMLAGGRKHYNTANGLETDDQIHGLEDDEDGAKAADNFREHFAFPATEILHSSFFASLQRVLPNYGKIYISDKNFSFRSLMPTSKTKARHHFS